MRLRPHSPPLILCLSLAFGLASCDFLPSSDEAEAPADFGMTFHGAYRDDAKTLDPALAYDTISLDVVSSIHETLYQYSYLSDSYRVEPLLAADLPRLSTDRLTVTIPIQRGIRFQDDECFAASQGKGRELKAQDFVFALKRLALPRLESQGWWILDGKIVGVNAWRARAESVHEPRETLALLDEPIEGIRALDDYTLQLKLTRPYPQLLFVLSMPFTSPVAREAARAYGDRVGALRDHPVGTGPFRLKEWKRGRQIVLSRNPTHHPEFYPTDGASSFRKQGMMADAGKTLPFLDQVTMRIIKEQQPAWEQFLEGRSDLISLPNDHFDEAITNQVNLSPKLSAKGIRLNIETDAVFFFLSFNMKDRLLGPNRLLRQALSSLVNRELWIELVTHGRGRKMAVAVAPGLRDRPKITEFRYDYDLKRAKALLRKAGYPDGKGLPVLKLDMRGADTLNRQMGEMFVRQFAEAGVKLNVVYNNFPSYLEKARTGLFQIGYGGWSMDYPDAENSYQLLYGPNSAPGPNETSFENPRFDSLFEQMEAMEPGPGRAAIIARMEGILQEEVPWAYGYHNVEYQLSQPWLLNYRPSEIILNRFKYLRVDSVVRNRYRESRK
jgi:oligopeptide transport system substrate-binding protein